MTRWKTNLLTLLAIWAIGPAAWGQGLLDKVEERVKRALDRTGIVPADVPPAADGVPAEPPAAGELPPPAPGEEEASSGYLGVVLEDIPGGGIRVIEVAKGSPAEKAGLKPGDQINTVNEAEAKDIEELGVLMEPVRVGGKLKLAVVRDGKLTTIEATLGMPPMELGDPLGPAAGSLPPPAEPGTAPAPGTAAQRASLGITVVTFNDEVRRRSDVPARNGAMITQIRPESPAARGGLPLGGVIVSYDGQPIDTADELVAAIAASRPGQEVELTYYQAGTLRRKTVKLAAASDPSLLGPGYGGLSRDRPLLGRVERAIEGLTRPGAAPGVGAGTVPGSEAVPDATGESRLPPAAGFSLRDEIEILKAKVATLEEKVAQLEAKLAGDTPPADAGPLVEPPAGAKAVEE